MSANKKTRKKKSSMVVGKNRKAYLESYGTAKGIFISTTTMFKKAAELIAIIGDLKEQVTLTEDQLKEVVTTVKEIVVQLEESNETFIDLKTKLESIIIPPNKAKELTAVKFYNEVQEITNGCLSTQENFLLESITTTLPDIIKLLESLEKKEEFHV